MTSQILHRDVSRGNILILLINQAVHPDSPVDLQFAEGFSTVILGREVAVAGWVFESDFGGRQIWL